MVFIYMPCLMEYEHLFKCIDFPFCLPQFLVLQMIAFTFFLQSIMIDLKPPNIYPLVVIYLYFSTFLAFTAIHLDPDTAYPCLWVSPCRTSVQVGKLQPNLPNNQERFTRYNIVLGSEAFSSGRHYWEVEVGSKTAWGLGVVLASVNRKEEISLCPEDGFWTLVLRDKCDGSSEYEACTDSEENLIHPSKPPKRVGIYLDYNHGEVAFYDAADMSHLFTFYDTQFKEPVYPYFNPWPIINGHNREPLTIVTPYWG